MTRIAIIDGMNFLHRARSGFTAGDHAVTYNFFRNLRAVVEKLDPQRLIFVLEGTPRDRLVEHPEYKANRVETIDVNDPASVKKSEELTKFFRQCDEAVSLMKRAFPISVMRHPHYECDDLIYTLCRQSPTTDVVTVVSNDTDFIQLLNEFSNVVVYNPHLKTNVETPSYDYVMWKALRGDATDNISKLPGIGDETATKAMTDSSLLQEIISRPGNKELFERNLRLIKLKEIPKTELDTLLEVTLQRDPKWIDVIADFKEWGFKSIFKEGTWEKFRGTFENLE